MPADTPWGEVVAAYPLVFVAAIAVIVLLLVGAWWFITKKLPAKDYALSFSADAQQPEFSADQKEEAVAWQSRGVFTRDLVEKVAMVSLISIIFSTVLPDVRATNLQLALGVAVVIALNAGISEWLARRGREWASIAREFVAMAVVNFGLAAAYVFLLPRFDGQLNTTNIMFFALLLTLLVVLYDRYRVTFLERFPSEA